MRIARCLRAAAAGLGVFLSAAVASEAAPGADAETRALARQAGALLVVGFQGRTPEAPGVRAAARAIAAGQVGGVLLFSPNIRTPDQVRRLVRHLRAQAPSGDLAVMIDQEGGRVARLRRRNGFEDYPSAAAAARLGVEKAGAAFDAMAGALASIGVTVNLGPVVDLAIEPRNPIITRMGRSFGSAPRRVAGLAGRFIAAHERAGVRTCLKHFPGHGSARRDTHKGFVSLEGLWRPELELAPFQMLAARGVGCVMTSHLFVPELAGPQRRIVTFAPDAVRLLRDQLGFQGVVISDDLRMGAVRDVARFDEAAVMALAAGHDMVISADFQIGRRSAARRFQDAVADALARGRLDPAELRASLARRAFWLARAGEAF